MGIRRVFGALLVLLVFSTGAWSANLTARDVQGFVNSMQELKPYFDQYADETGDEGDAGSTAQIVSDWARSLKEQQDVQVVLTKNGFDHESWAVISQQVTSAYMALKFGKDGHNVIGEMRQSMTEIEANADIPAEQKTQMVTQMKQSMAEMEKVLSAPVDDQNAVKPYLSKLDAIFEWQE